MDKVCLLRVVAVVLCLLAPGMVRCNEDTGRPNVLLITSEDNGPELGCYGDPYAKTPNLDKLAREGVRFANAFVTNPVCSPSRGTIFTGLYPHQNGQIGLATHKYSMFKKWPNVVSILKAAGYRTGIIGKIHVNPESAFPCDYRALPGSNFNMRDMDRFSAAAEAFIIQKRDPFFLMVNFPDAHLPLIRQYAGLPETPLEGGDVKTMPWVGTDSDRLSEAAANYYNCLSRLDTGVGRLLEMLKRTGRHGNTLIVYLGDHGPQFSRGKCCLYEAGLRVPFIVNWPGRIKPATVRYELISTIDILPTILEATQCAGPDNLPGRSLLPLCWGGKVLWREHLFAEQEGSTPFWTHPSRSVRDERYKLIINLRQDMPNPIYEAYLTQFNVHFKAGANWDDIAAAPQAVQSAYDTWKAPPPVELYDLKNDPHEWDNLADQPQCAKVQERLMRAMNDWRRRTADPSADPEKLGMLFEEMDGVMREKVKYRNEEGFRWNYLDYYKVAE
ncbi:MAG: sulfatase family protein [Planctomycetota bacterium]